LWMGYWGLEIGPKPQTPIPNPQSPIPNEKIYLPFIKLIKIKNKFYLNNFEKQNLISMGGIIKKYNLIFI